MSESESDLSRRSDAEADDHRLLRVLDEYGRVLRDAVARVCRGPLGLQRDEIEQEARIRLWRALRRETTIVDLRLYLHRIVATAAIDAMRQVRSRRETPLESPNFEGDDQRWTSVDVATLAGGASPERIVSGRELVGVARHVLAGLPANRRRAVGLYLQGFTSEEIARIMGWSEAKARNLVYRGLGELREKLRSATAIGPDVPIGPATPGEVGR